MADLGPEGLQLGVRGGQLGLDVRRVAASRALQWPFFEAKKKQRIMDKTGKGGSCFALGYLGWASFAHAVSWLGVTLARKLRA